jgi:hypothetical protein
MSVDNQIEWTQEAVDRLREVPDGFMKDMTKKRITAFAQRKGYSTVTLQVVEEKYAEWGMKSGGKERTLEWTSGASERIMRIPEFIRGTVAASIESYAQEKGAQRVTEEIMEEAKGQWGITSTFHP